ncbi:MAG: flagellar export chaperone FliS [Rhodospirillaceae bacterium]
MSFASQYAVKAYAKVEVETGVATADPHELVLMLYEGAMTAIINAERHMASGEVAGKGESISKAIMIIDDGLAASLDVAAGGAIAENLRALYAYMSQRLLAASVSNDPAPLQEVRKLLGELKGAWASIKPAPRTAGAAQTAAYAAPRAY